MPDAFERIARLQEQHRRPEPDRSIGGLVSSVAVEAERTQQRLGSFVDLWEGLVPADVASHTRVVGLRGGVAHVTVDSSSTAYEIDRRLREGLEQQLRRAYGKTLIRVKVTVGEFR
ncbi:MAG: DciA family protein [Planctomycetota bacterium]|jgi:predicted nucleic acid-binding Zn ribbon protein